MGSLESPVRLPGKPCCASRRYEYIWGTAAARLGQRQGSNANAIRSSEHWLSKAFNRMTMVGAAAAPGFAVLVSDRLVTLARGREFAGEHDAMANKTVVYLGHDGLLLLGYTGSAYLNGVPTDEWIAQVLWGPPFYRNPDGGLPTAVRGNNDGPRGINQVLLTLRRRLSEVPNGRKVSVVASGWRSRRRRLYPILISFSGADPCLASPSMVLRPPRRREFVHEVVGALPPPEVVEAALAEPRHQPRNGHEAADWVVSLFTSVIRRTAAQNPTVGPHVMTVTVPHPANRRISCRFDPKTTHYACFAHAQPEARTPTVFSPWIVSEFGYQSPMVMGGIAGFKTKFREWEVEFLGFDAPSAMEGFGFVLDQRRRPMPGTRARR